MAKRKTTIQSKKAVKKAVKKVPLKELPITRFIPNMATMMALCTGLSAIHFAMMDRYEMALGAIVIAGILDVLDGRLARMLGAESDFGAEFDSLSDFVSFGVVPAVVTYMWSLHHWKGWGWGFCLFFVVCSGWRLARFNTHLKNPDTKMYGSFFMGVPAPMGAYVALLPMITGFALDLDEPLPQIVYGVFLIGAGLLMVSAIPTFATKTLKFTRKMVVPIILGLGLLFIALLNAPWMVLAVVGIAYVLTMPLSYRTFLKKHPKMKEAK